MKLPRLIAAATAALASCSVPADDLDPVGPHEKRVSDPAVGVSLVVPETWVVKRDEALFDTHGFILFDPAASDHSDGAVARIALAYQARPADLPELAATKMKQYAAVAPERREIELASGARAVAITGLPGTSHYSIVYVAEGDRVYELGFWSDEPGLGQPARELLERVRFEEPAVAVDSLDLAAPEAVLYGRPPDELAELGQQAEAERKEMFERAAALDPDLAAAATAEVLEPPAGVDSDGDHRAAPCGFTAPATLYWQLQWDWTNTFYNGSWYNLRSVPGWSAMSGNYGSWWGTNFHIWRCHAGLLNQWYANDWPAQYWANAYAAFSGTVEWAGWGTDGFASLGRYVVVRNGQYRSLTAHLIRIADGIYWGARINGYYNVIGWAGDTGEYYAGADWAPHLHARVAWGESLTYNGQPYGGHSVRPLRLRCFDCNNHDVDAPGAGGYYTRFWHGRWMKY